MATTKAKISEWLERGKKKGATHMIVATDTFSYEDFPVFVGPKEKVELKIKEYRKPNEMLRVREVYSYSLDLEMQLNERRAWHI
jgi:hypothetical protein